MSQFGDSEAHRRVLHEIATLPDGAKTMAYLKAAVMGSVGSAKAAAALHETPGLTETPSRLMRVQLALLSLTVRAAKGSSRYAQDYQDAVEAIDDVTRHVRQLRDQQRRAGQEVPVNALPGAVFTSLPTTAAARALPSFGAKEAGGTGEVLEEFLYVAMAYVNYVRGFTALWAELFGPTYFIFNHETGVTENTPQVPPHLYAVDWQSVLSPERQAWSRGLHDMTKELLRMIVTRAMPAEVYFLYILYAALSLRMRLLETAAELFTWSALLVDIPYCVRQLYISYRAQCEFARLQDVWHSFNLSDDAFVADCERFNLECSAAQGALFETAQDPLQSPTSAATTPFGCLRSGAAAFPTQYLHGAAAHDVAAVGVGPSCRGDRDSLPSSLAASASDGEGESDEAGERRDGGGDRRVGAKRKTEVYVPMFHTQCRFTWLLQRLFWSLYGRCTLLFGSCIKLELAPRLSAHVQRHSETLAEAIAARTKGLGDGRALTDPPGTTPPPQLLAGPPGRRRPSPSPPASTAAAPTLIVGRASGGDSPSPRHPVAAPAAAPSARRTSWAWRLVRASLSKTHHSTVPRGAAASPATAATPSSLAEAEAAVGPPPPTDAPAALVRSLTNDESTPLPAEPQPPFFLRYTWHKEKVGMRRPRSGDEEVAANAELATPDELAAEYLAEFTFLTMGGCYVLAHAFHLALTNVHFPATIIMLSDNTTRPGLRNWVDHRYVISAVVEDPTERRGMEPWVLNYVLPRFRLSRDAAVREEQEVALVESIVPELLRHRGAERVAFARGDSLFYVLNAGPYTDQGRNYFALHMHVGNCATSGPLLLQSETSRAFAGLEEVRLAWYMTCSTNEAVRLATAFDATASF